MITLTSDLPHVDLESDPHYGYDSVEKFGEPFDAYIEANIDADSGGTCVMCDTGIGSSLHDDFTDDGHRFRAVWTWMTLVVIDGKVLTLCEGCSMPLDPDTDLHVPDNSCCEDQEDVVYQAWKERDL